MKKLKLYKISEKYIHFLREVDPVNVKYNKKERRPYVGVVLEIQQFFYFAPLASPKPKHLTMKNSLDFIKIDGGTLGVINLINQHTEEICKKAQKLYLSVTKYHSYLENRCAKFKELEKKSLEYF